MKLCSTLSGTARLPLIFQIWSGLSGTILWSWTIAFVLMPSKLNCKICFLLLGFIINLFFSHQSRGRLSDLVAEHLDHIHYVNDILCLSIDNLNEVLVEQLFQRLLLPLYINSLNKGNASKNNLFHDLKRKLTFLRTSSNEKWRPSCGHPSRFPLSPEPDFPRHSPQAFSSHHSQVTHKFRRKPDCSKRR